MVNDFIYVKAEEEGLSSNQITSFVQAIEKASINLHSFMLVRRGKILAEAYCAPFHADFPHRLYSASKTYVSMAIGKLVEEGKVKLTDSIISHFPEFLAQEQHKWMRETTIEDMLKISVPMLTDTYCDFSDVNKALGYRQKWAWSFFNSQEILKPAGTVFNYNTSGTFTLCVLVEKLTGKTFLEYLRPVFDKIGVSKDIWCVKSPDGYAWGGSGVVSTLRDFAKFAELIMYKGAYKGEQLLPREYMERATSKQISTICENDLGNWRGYGYQIWVGRHGYALLGMGCQTAYCFPDKELLFVCNGDTQSIADYDEARVYAYVEDKLYNALQDVPLAADEEACQRMQTALNNWSLPTGLGEKYSPFAEQIRGKKYLLNPNPMGWKWFQLDIEGEKGVLTYENERGVKKIPFGMDTYAQATFPETYYYDKQVDVPADRELDCIACAGWTEPQKLLLRVYIIDTNMGNCFMSFGFKGSEVGIGMMKKAEFFMDEYVGFAGGRREA